MTAPSLLPWFPCRRRPYLGLEWTTTIPPAQLCSTKSEPWTLWYSFSRNTTLVKFPWLLLSDSRDFHEWPHRQGGCLACCRLEDCKIESLLWVSCIDLYYARGAQGVLPTRVGGCDQSIGSTVSDATVRNWLWSTASRSSHLAASVDYCKSLTIDPTFCGSRCSTWLLAIEYFTLLLLPHTVGIKNNLLTLMKRYYYIFAQVYHQR